MGNIGFRDQLTLGSSLGIDQIYKSQELTRSCLIDWDWSKLILWLPISGLELGTKKSLSSTFFPEVGE